MLGFSVTQAYAAFFVLCLPICLWVAWSDLKFMKIPNTAVMALLAVYVVAGLALIPLEPWLWRWTSFAVVLGIGFLLNAFANVGAGDAKFAAAAAPFFVQKIEHLSIALVLLAFWLLAAFFLHRGLRMIPAVRRATPDWKSWTSARFPMGLALVAVLLSYLALVAFPGFCAVTYGRFSPVCG